MPRTKRASYVLAGSFKGNDGRTYTFRVPVGTSNPEDVQYQHAKKRIARAVQSSPKYGGGPINFKLEGK